MASHWLDGWAKERAGEAANGTGAKTTAGRFQLDNAAFRARLDAATRPAPAAGAERRTA